MMLQMLLLMSAAFERNSVFSQLFCLLVYTRGALKKCAHQPPANSKGKSNRTLL